MDRRSPGDQRLEEQTLAGAGGLVSAAQAGIAVSAKGQLLGAATAGRDHLEERLRRVALTIPATGIPDLPAPPGLTVLPGADPGDPGAGPADPIEVAALAPADPSSESEPAPMATLSGLLPPPAPPRPSEAVAEPPASTAAGAPDPGLAVLPAAPPAPPDAEPADTPRSSEGGGVVGMAHAAAAALEPDAPAAGLPETLVARRGPVGRALPDMALPDGALPDMAPGRVPIWLQNAVAPAIDDRPAVALVIDDLGVNRKGTAATIRLDAPLTLAFLPYAAHLTEQTRAARAAGHELMVHMPMEPAGDEYPGPNALLASLEPADLVSRLRSQLRSFRGFVGVNNHMGSLLTANGDYMSLVMAELRRHGLLFLDSRTTPRSVAAREARRLNVPYAERDVFLDNEIKLDAVLKQLERVEKIARSKGYAVAIGHPHDLTVEALRRWLPTLDARGFALVPISAIVARRACAEGAPALHDACARYTAIASLQP